MDREGDRTWSDCLGFFCAVNHIVESTYSTGVNSSSSEGTAASALLSAKHDWDTDCTDLERLLIAAVS